MLSCSTIAFEGVTIGDVKLFTSQCEEYPTTYQRRSSKESRVFDFAETSSDRPESTDRFKLHLLSTVIFQTLNFVHKIW